MKRGVNPRNFGANFLELGAKNRGRGASGRVRFLAKNVHVVVVMCEKAGNLGMRLGGSVASAAWLSTKGEETRDLGLSLRVTPLSPGEEIYPPTSDSVLSTEKRSLLVPSPRYSVQSSKFRTLRVHARWV